jgi:preprotein translocase subunit YajC
LRSSGSFAFHRVVMSPAKGIDTLHTLALALPGGPAQFLPIVLIFGALYLLMIVPNQKKQKRWNEMLGKIKSGDVVVTTGGIRGTVLSVRDDVMVLRIAPDNIKLEFSKSAIASVTTADGQIDTK